MTPFTTTRRVEFGDTDMAGIMHFSNFFRFMEVAETEYLRAHGMTVAWQAGSERLGFPRVSAACDYQQPAHFEDVLTIAVSIDKLGRKSIAYRFEFTCEGKPIASGRITAVYCRKTATGLESLDIPADLRAQLEA